jgi:uncharacterized repeat protein (TIGR03843 family)
VAHPALTAALTDGELTVTGRLLQASNATFLAELTAPCGPIECVYKPVEGERPLWDFPQRTLGYREVAAYEVSRIGGFDCVPVTVFTDGPLGPGSLQAWVDADEAETGRLVDLVPSTQVPAEGWFPCVQGLDAEDRPVTVIHADTPDLKLLAVFDVLVNNADRKGGHILPMPDGRRLGVDHGVTFHVEPKLRTVLWGWLGERLDPDELAGVDRVRSALTGDLGDRLEQLLTAAERAALAARCDRLLREGRFPAHEGDMPAMPWPLF